MKITIRKIAVSLGFVLIYYIWFQAFYSVTVEHSFFPFKSMHSFITHVIRNLIMYCLIFGYNYIVVFKIRIFHDTIVKKLIKDFILSTVFFIILNLIYTAVLFLINGRIPFLDWGATFINNVTVMIIIETAYYVRSYRNSLKELEIKNTKMLQYQYDALKAQVNPHFLFNSLSILYSLIECDKDKSLQYTMSLSQTYRYIVSKQDSKMALLSEEIAFLKSFANVLMIRYNEAFHLEIRGEDKIGEQYVIPYCLQLLLENVIKHNVINEENPMCVKLNIEEDGVMMRNPIRLRQTLNSSKIGLSYIQKMHEIYGKQFLYNNDNNIFSAKIFFLK